MLLTWENGPPGPQEFGAGKFDIIYPPAASTPAPVGHCGQERRQEGHSRGGSGLPRIPAQLKAGTFTGIKNFYRPTDAKAAAKYAKQFPKINLFKIDDVFGGWTRLRRLTFADGGVF